MPNDISDQMSRVGKSKIESLEVSVKVDRAGMSSPRDQQIALRLSTADLTLLRETARKYKVGHTTLARTVVEKWIDGIRKLAN